MSSLGLKLEDALVVIPMVISLPESYSTLKTILMSTEDKLLPDAVIAQVLIEEKSCKNPAQTALLAYGGKGKGKKDHKGDQDKKKCSYCKKKGHIRDECRCLKAAENKEQKTSTSTSEKEKKDGELTTKVTTIAEQPAKTESLHLFVTNTLTQQLSLLIKWIIDSGASSPMSSQCNWFHMCHDITPPKKVWLGNECYILATGIGQLHLEMNLVGRKKCLTIIQTAYYVPNLSGNLISVSYLTKQGYSVNFDNSQCQIFTKSGKLCGVAQDIDCYNTRTQHYA